MFGEEENVNTWTADCESPYRFGERLVRDIPFIRYSIPTIASVSADCRAFIPITCAKFLQESRNTAVFCVADDALFIHACLRSMMGSRSQSLDRIAFALLASIHGIRQVAAELDRFVENYKGKADRFLVIVSGNIHAISDQFPSQYMNSALAIGNSKANASIGHLCLLATGSCGYEESAGTLVIAHHPFDEDVDELASFRSVAPIVVDLDCDSQANIIRTTWNGRQIDAGTNGYQLLQPKQVHDGYRIFSSWQAINTSILSDLRKQPLKQLEDNSTVYACILKYRENTDTIALATIQGIRKATNFRYDKIKRALWQLTDTGFLQPRAGNRPIEPTQTDDADALVSDYRAKAGRPPMRYHMKDGKLIAVNLRVVGAV